MQEEKNQTTGTNATADDAGTQKRDEEATSSETLSDLEDEKKVTADKSTYSSGGATGAASSGDAPSPDGAFDEGGGGGRADGSDTGGPM